jgi:hypothetical protein
MLEHGFVRIREPAAAEFTNQSFAPPRAQQSIATS